jgi:spore coat protein U-like protein
VLLSLQTMCSNRKAVQSQTEEINMGIDRKIKALALAAAATVCGAASAGTDTASLAVTANVAKACVVGSPTTMAFGTLSLLDAAAGKVVESGNADAEGKFFTACTNGATGVTYSFTGGAASGFALASAGGDTIAYTLFSDSALSAEITRGTAATAGDFAGFAADGDNHELTVYGRIDLAANVAKPVGSYSDTVTITVSYD